MQSKSCKIALITTGGTISSALSGGVLSAGKTDLGRLLSDFNFYKIYSPLCILSENADFADIGKMYSEILKAQSDGCDGIIMTHGTDSLSYSAAALALLLCKISIPVVIVSADYPLGDVRSNGFSNLRAAVEFIKEGWGGVYVSYTNPTEVAKIHFAARLNYTRGFDGYVSSAMDKICGYFENDKFVLTQPPVYFSGDFAPVLNPSDEGRVGLVMPYTGLTYAAINKCGFEEIVHDSYHSGTVKTDGENNINCLNAKVFLAGALGGDKYESVKKIGKNIVTVENISPVALYFKRVLSLGFDEKCRTEYMYSNTANEFFM